MPIDIILCVKKIKREKSYVMIISTAIYLKRSSEKKSSEKTIIKTVLKHLRNEKERAKRMLN